MQKRGSCKQSGAAIRCAFEACMDDMLAKPKRCCASLQVTQMTGSACVVVHTNRASLLCLSCSSLPNSRDCQG